MDMVRLHLRLPSSRARLFARIAFFDMAWACASPALAFVIRDGALSQPDTAALYCSTAFIASLLCFQWFRISSPLSHYFSAHDAIEVAKATLMAVALTAVFSFTFVRLGNSPRSVPILHFFILTSGLVLQRSVYRLAETRRTARQAASKRNGPKTLENIIIVQASRLAWFYTKMVGEFARHRTRIVAILDTRPEFYGRSLNGYAVVGSPSHLTRIIDEYIIHGVEIHKVVVAGHPGEVSEEMWNEVRGVCSKQQIKIESLLELFSSTSAENDDRAAPSIAPDDSYADVFGSPYWKIKRLLDIVLAATAIVVILPLTIVVTVCVLIDVGYPVLFWQQRVGHLGRPLFLYKFRTMAAPYDRNGTPIADSARLSRLGRILRVIRVDEIPQLANILTGHMSLIGPRPLLPVDQPENIRLRLRVRPGLTGLAQINGGKLLTPEEKDVLDDWYIRHASIMLDLSILARTFWVILRGDRRNEGEISAAVQETRSQLYCADRRSQARPRLTDQPAAIAHFGAFHKVAEPQ